MYPNYNYRYNPIMNNRNDRFAGGFLGPFLLGGLTGGLVAPLFYNNRPNYYYPPYYYPYQSYYYGGYYR